MPAQSSPEADPHLRIECPICSSRRLHYAFSRAELRFVRCTDCRLLFRNPDIGWEPTEGRPSSPSHASVEKAQVFFTHLESYTGCIANRLLLLGPLSRELRIEAEKRGYSVTESNNAEDVASETFDVCVVWHTIAQSTNPSALLANVHRILKTNGCIALANPSLDSMPARLLSENWPGFSSGIRSFFDSRAVQAALFYTGFNRIIVQRATRLVSIDEIDRYFESVSGAFFALALRTLAHLSPRFLRNRKFQVEGSDLYVFSRRTPVQKQRLLSVVIPAFNEASTFEELLQQVLAKSIPGLDIEIIVVESNSTDGTREIALRYKNVPRVKLILEDRPRGKGHAVRTGLKEAVGDFIIIQDADLEYDLEDYDALLEPLIAGREAFVLGSRHAGTVWKMRKFEGQASLSAFLNLGHWFFTTLVNRLFGQRLMDPFTMFKVFRRDCLYGLSFNCNRFDFDYELLVKLIRKGYMPIEIPVNYRSRSFKEGKKVSMIRDPLTWLWALLKLRIERIDPLSEIKRQNRVALAQNVDLTLSTQKSRIGVDPVK